MDEGKKDSIVRPFAAPDIKEARALIISPDGKDARTIVEELTEGKVIDITKGFPAKDKEQFWDIILGLFRQKITRIPIIGVEEEDNGKTVTKVYMRSNPKGRMQHLTLWEELGSPENISFTTSIEGFRMNVPISSPSYLIVPDIIFELNKKSPCTCYLPFGQGSDLGAFLSEHPLSKKFTNKGKETIKNIFNIEGVESHGL